MKLRTKGVPALIVTCAFAMFAVAAIPEAAKASSYYDDMNMSFCVDISCGDMSYGNNYGYGTGYNYGYYDPMMYSYPTYYYSYPTSYTYYTYPVVNQYNPYYYRQTPDYFFSDYWGAANDWDAHMRYYNAMPL